MSTGCWERERQLPSPLNRFNQYTGHERGQRKKKREAIEAALMECKGRVSGPFGVASQLGLPSSTLESKIKALRIDKGRFRQQ